MAILLLDENQNDPSNTESDLNSRTTHLKYIRIGPEIEAATRRAYLDKKPKRSYAAGARY